MSFFFHNLGVLLTVRDKGLYRCSAKSFEGVKVQHRHHTTWCRGKRLTVKHLYVHIFKLEMFWTIIALLKLFFKAISRLSIPRILLWPQKQIIPIQYLTLFDFDSSSVRSKGYTLNPDILSSTILSLFLSLSFISSLTNSSYVLNHSCNTLQYVTMKLWNFLFSEGPDRTRDPAFCSTKIGPEGNFVSEVTSKDTKFENWLVHSLQPHFMFDLKCLTELRSSVLLDKARY